MKLYPVFASLKDRDVLVVGGGAVAERKCRALLAAGARVTVGSPYLNQALARWRAEAVIRHLAGEFDECWLDDMWIVVAATDDAGINRRVAAAAGQRRLFVNVVDDAELSTFHVPAIVERGSLQVAISSAGAAPMLARQLREQFEALLDQALGPLVELLQRTRATIRRCRPDLATRRAFYAGVLSGPVFALLRSRRHAQAERTLLRDLEQPVQSEAGSVVIVGAGPGDPGLLTLAALRALNEADVILHDRLVSAEVLELARRDAERIEVGKQSGNHRFSQQQIHALMLQHVRRGRRVVRLKGGDPFVFGRGGEELQFLRAHGIAYEVVPGITAALACAAYSGIPLTHRDHARSLRLATAHCRESLDAIDWRALAAPDQTVAIYMGLAQLPAIRAQLLAAGMPARTPVAIVENGTRPDQRVIAARLDDLGELAERHDLVSPAMLIVGAVAGMAADLGWFGAEPIIHSVTDRHPACAAA